MAKETQTAVVDREEKEKKLYELALLLKREEDLAPMLALISQRGGEIVTEPRAKKLALAYKIKGNTEGVFISFTFRMLPDDAKGLEEDLNPRQDVIRFMVLVSPPPSAEQPAFSSAASAMKPRRGRPSTAFAPAPEAKPAARPSSPLSNEALEKKIEEILQ